LHLQLSVLTLSKEKHMKTDSHSAPELGATLLRLALGAMYLAHAGLKIFTFSMAGTVQFFASVGYPGWLAYVVVGAEILAGVLLIAGIKVRAVALAMLPVLLGAAAVHWPNGWVFNAQGGGWEYPVFLTIASIVQALVGAGAYALRWERSVGVYAQRA
jgi:putative oxidoreductase